MSDPSTFSDEELAKAAGLTPNTAPASTGDIQALSDEELHKIAGTTPEQSLPDGAFRGPSGKVLPAPTFQDAVMAQIPFASDAAGAGNALVQGVGNLIHGQSLDLGNAYEEGRKDFWASNERYKEDHPLLDKGAQIAGTVASLGSAPVSVANAGGNILAQSVRSAGTAAPIGAVYGFGTSDGDLADRAKAAGIGGLIGGLIGVAAPAISRGIGAGTEAVQNFFGLGDPNARAAALLQRALGRDNLTPDDLSSALQTAPDKPLTIADIAGSQKSATSRLARTVLDTPGEGSSTASQFLADRDLGTGVNGPNDMFRTGGTADRIIGDVKSALGSDDAFQTAADLIQQRQQQSAPLYDAFRAQPPTPARQVQSFMSSPTFRKAVGRANTSVLDEGASPMMDLIDFDADGNALRVKGGAFPPDTLDRIKQGLDDTWLAAKTSGDAGAARTANSLRQRFVSFMDQKYPDTYAAARQAYSGPSASLNAIQQGAEVFKTAPQDIASTLANLAPEDRDMFRTGVQQALISKIKGTADGANEVRVLLGTPAKRESVAAAFEDPNALNQLATNLGWENRMYQTRQLDAGSRTAPSLMDHEDSGMVGPLMHAGSHAAGGNLHGAAMQLVGPVLNRLRTGMGEGTASSLADMLLNPANNASTIDMLRGLPADQQRLMLARAMSLTPRIANTGAILGGEAQ